MPEYYEGELGWSNLAMPSIYAADDATALYPRGTRFVAGERTFYYGTYRGVVNPGASAYTVTATNGDDLAFKCLFTVAYNQDMSNAELVRKVANELALIYSATINDGARVNNWYSGGFVSGKDSTPADERMFSRFITRHIYQATGSSYDMWNDANQAYTAISLTAYTHASILELDQPIINTKTGMATVIHTNPWKHAIWQNSSGYVINHGPLGFCMHNDPTATRHVWFQTWGPMFCPHYHAGTGVGQTDTEVEIALMGDGSIQARSSNYDYHVNSYFPVIGYRLGSTIFETASRAVELLPMIYVQMRR